MLDRREKKRVEEAFKDFYFNQVVKILLSTEGIRKYLNLELKRKNYDCDKYDDGRSCSYPQTASESIIEGNSRRLKHVLQGAKKEMERLKQSLPKIIDEIERTDPVAPLRQYCHRCSKGRGCDEEPSIISQLVTIKNNPDSVFYTARDLNYLIFVSLQDEEEKVTTVSDEEVVAVRYEKNTARLKKERLKAIREKYPDAYRDLSYKVKGLDGHVTTVFHEGILLLAIKEIEETRLARFKKPEQRQYWNKLAEAFLRELDLFSISCDAKKFGDFWLLREYIASKTEEPEIEI